MSQRRSGQLQETSPVPIFDPRTVQPVASRYTDYATRPTRRREDTGNWKRKYYIAFCGELALEELLTCPETDYGMNK